MHVGAVAEVGEDVAGAGEWRLADPGHALAAHLTEGPGGFRRQPGRHVVAADAGDRPGALGHLGRAVVGAAGAVMGDSLRRQPRPGQGSLLGVEEGQACANPVRSVETADAGGDHPRDHRRRQVAGSRQLPSAVGTRPLPLLVELADHPRADVLLPVVELFLQLVFEELALLLDHQDLVEAFGEFTHALRFERPHHADLVQADADVGSLLLVDAEILQRLSDVEIALARRDDAEPRLRRIDHAAVELVHPAVGEGGVELVVHQPFFLHQRRVGPAQVEPAFGQRELGFGRNPGLDPVGIDVDRGGGLDGVGQRLEGDPATGIARHREAVQAVLEVVLDAGRRQHRHHHRLEYMLGLVRQRRRLGAVVVAGDHQHAAMLRRAGGVGVAEDVAAAVDPRPLAVPDREDAVMARVVVKIELLGTPHRRGGEVLVQPRLEANAVGVEEGLRLGELLVHVAQRRAAIAGDIAGGVEAGTLVAQALHDRQAHQRLDAGHVGASALQRVFVRQADVVSGLGHGLVRAADDGCDARGAGRRRKAALLCLWVGVKDC